MWKLNDTFFSHEKAGEIKKNGIEEKVLVNMYRKEVEVKERK